MKGRHRKAVLIVALSTAAAVALGAGGATAAFAATSSAVSAAAAVSSTAATTSADHVRLRSELAREIAVDVRSASGDGDRAQKIAATLIGHPKLFAKLPADLQTDLTALKNASSADAATDATAIKTKALAGGYGDRVKTLAEHVQTRLQSRDNTASPSPTPGS